MLKPEKYISFAIHSISIKKLSRSCNRDKTYEYSEMGV